MNLAKAEPRAIAMRIFSGSLEIGAVPTGQRARVSKELTTLKAEAEARAEAEAAKAKTKKKGGKKNASEN
jgi:hypothetical protein